MENLDLKIVGVGTREEIATALRLMADAFDGKENTPKQDIEDIDGSYWLDCSFETFVKEC